MLWGVREGVRRLPLVVEMLPWVAGLMSLLLEVGMLDLLPLVAGLHQCCRREQGQEPQMSVSFKQARLIGAIHQPCMH
jgi:hypothetical protein